MVVWLSKRRKWNLKTTTETNREEERLKRYFGEKVEVSKVGEKACYIEWCLHQNNNHKIGIIAWSRHLEWKLHNLCRSRKIQFQVKEIKMAFISEQEDGDKSLFQLSWPSQLVCRQPLRKGLQKIILEHCCSVLNSCPTVVWAHMPSFFGKKSDPKLLTNTSTSIWE